TQTVAVVDTTAPVLSGCPGDVTNECSVVSAPAAVTATDNCDSNPVVSLSQSTNSGSCAQSYSITRVCEHVEVVIARGAVGAETDPDVRRQVGLDRRDAAGEFHVALGIMRDADAA